MHDLCESVLIINRVFHAQGNKIEGDPNNQGTKIEDVVVNRVCILRFLS